jgi:DNA polymerase III delta prime subunit
VTEEILKPVLRSVTETPVDCVSFLLYGPPGTRKTTFVEEMASALRWPLLTLSPPAFLSNGIEGFEAAADDIFEELLHLQRVVVLFDECEEFFRWRSSPTTVESRTIGAFITSGMLPRLQALRKARSVIFVINTNIEAYELDDAVTRRGRLDRAARVGHPLLPAQKRYLEKWESRISGKTLTEEHTSWFTRLLNEVETAMQEPRERLTSEREKAQKSHPDRGEGYRALMTTIRQDEAKELTKVVTFGMLDELAERCLGEGTQTPIESEESLSTNLEQEFERFGPDKFHSVPNDT